MATKSVKKLTFQDRATKVKKVVKNFNKGSLDISYEIVDEGLALGSQWQELFAKTMKKSTRLFGKQQELLLSTLEEIKEQFIDGNGKVVKLLELDRLTKNITKRIDKTITPAKDAIEAQIKSTTRKVRSVGHDDLSHIKGIGEKTKLILNKAGIRSFRDLVTFKEKEIINVLESANLKSMVPKVKGWIAQAKKLG